MFYVGLCIGLFVGMGIAAMVLCMCKVAGSEYPDLEADDELR